MIRPRVGGFLDGLGKTLPTRWIEDMVWEEGADDIADSRDITDSRDRRIVGDRLDGLAEGLRRGFTAAMYRREYIKPHGLPHGLPRVKK